MLCTELDVNGQGGREPISVKNTQLYVTLWYLGVSDNIIGKGDRFGIAESVVVCRKQIIDTTLKNRVNVY